MYDAAARARLPGRAELRRPRRSRGRPHDLVDRAGRAARPSTTPRSRLVAARRAPPAVLLPRAAIARVAAGARAGLSRARRFPRASAARAERSASERTPTSRGAGARARARARDDRRAARPRPADARAARRSRSCPKRSGPCAVGTWEIVATQDGGPSRSSAVQVPGAWSSSPTPASSRTGASIAPTPAVLAVDLALARGTPWLDERAHGLVPSRGALAYLAGSPAQPSSPASSSPRSPSPGTAPRSRRAA